MNHQIKVASWLPAGGAAEDHPGAAGEGAGFQQETDALRGGGQKLQERVRYVPVCGQQRSASSTILGKLLVGWHGGEP